MNFHNFLMIFEKLICNNLKFHFLPYLLLNNRILMLLHLKLHFYIISQIIRKMRRKIINMDNQWQALSVKTNLNIKPSFPRAVSMLSARHVATCRPHLLLFFCFFTHLSRFYSREMRLQTAIAATDG